MKLLHICESVTGGIATYLNELVPYQVELYGEDNVRVVIPFTQKEQINLPRDLLIFFDDVNRKSFKNQLKMLRIYLNSLKLFKPSTVHLHSTFAGFWFRLPLFFIPNRDYQVFYCSHGWAFDMEKSRYAKSSFAFIERLLSCVTDKIICISDHDRHSAMKRGVRSDKLIVVKNTINEILDDVKQANVDEDFKNFLFVGRFDQQKGFDRLIEAISSSKNSNFRLYCIGQTVTENDNITNSIIEKDKRIVHLGWKTKTEVLEYMKACDALIMPSRWEGFGLVALESLCCGCPVYHSGVGGLSELYPNSDYSVTLEEPITDSIRHLIENSSKEQLTENKIFLKKNFNHSYTTKDLSQEIDRLYTAIDSIGRDKYKI